MQKKQIIVAAVITAVIIGPLSFVLGKHMSSSRAPQMATTNRSQMGGNTQRGMQGVQGMRTGAAFGGGVSGEVVSKDDTSMTLKLADGGSRIVFFGKSTQVTNQTSGSASDVVVGKTVSVTGTTNQDGSVTAQMVQVRPVGSMQQR